MGEIFCTLYDKDFYLVEKNDSGWKVGVVRGKGKDLEKRLRDDLGIRVSLESNIGRWAMFAAGNVETQRVKPDEAYQTLYHQYLTAHVELTWDEYVEAMSGFKVRYSSQQQRELTRNLITKIKKNPSLVGIVEQGGLFFEEVKFANRMRGRFHGWVEMKNFLENGIDPRVRTPAGGLTQADIVYVHPKKSYVIELKFKNGLEPNTWTSGHFISTRQLKIAGNFISHNFDIDFQLIGITYNFRGMWHKRMGFDKAKRELRTASKGVKSIQE